jgi:four helix bundle protein
MSIALKEASETSYWLDIIHATDYLPDEMFNNLNDKCEELLSILTAITKNQHK